MRIFSLVTLAGIAVLSMSAAYAGEPAYVGTWGNDATQCKKPQESQNAPMVVTANGYDQHEAHCTFSSIEKSGEIWTMKTTCSVEGDEQTGQMTLSVTGNTLTIDGTSKWQRC